VNKIYLAENVLFKGGKLFGKTLARETRGSRCGGGLVMQGKTREGVCAGKSAPLMAGLVKTKLTVCLSQGNRVSGDIKCVSPGVGMPREREGFCTIGKMSEK